MMHNNEVGDNKVIKQAGAELCQAQVKLGLTRFARYKISLPLFPKIYVIFFKKSLLNLPTLYREIESAFPLPHRTKVVFQLQKRLRLSFV